MRFNAIIFILPRLIISHREFIKRKPRIVYKVYGKSSSPVYLPPFQ